MNSIPKHAKTGNRELQTSTSKPSTEISTSAAIASYAELMNSVHVVINPKGGVGKSRIAALLAEYFMTMGLTLSCVDADPTIRTFSTYKAFEVSRIKNLMVRNVVVERAFDGLVERITKEHGKINVIDTGGSGFAPFMNYMIECDALEELSDHGKKVFYHIPIVSGQSQMESIVGFETILGQVPEFVNIVLWLNEYRGQISVDGVPFMESTFYTKRESQLFGVVRHQVLTTTYDVDIRNLLEKHLSFAEAIASDDFDQMAKRRLRKMRKTMFGNLDIIFDCDTSASIQK